jgi:hypothetical protein
MLTGAQVKAARALLGWSITKLEGSTGVCSLIIANFEAAKGRPSVLQRTVLRRVLAAAGVEFEDDGQVRLREGKR